RSRFTLVKADVEAVSELAGAFGVQSIPAVFGLRDGRVVDRFVGALPEPALRAWIEGLFPTALEAALAQARSLEAADPAAAEAWYRDALSLASGDRDAQIGLARVLLRQGRFDEARAFVAALEGHGHFDDEVESVKAELELKAQARETGGVDAARAALAAKPGDPSARLGLAEALAAAGSYEEALETFLSLVEEGPREFVEPARLAMVQVFQILPPDSELANTYRRRLSAALF
ncbi:MAG: tetratricopeptide repeat protein, partial [Isosphaeraceae bacterium]